LFLSPPAPGTSEYGGGTYLWYISIRTIIPPSCLILLVISLEKTIYTSLGHLDENFFLERCSDYYKKLSREKIASF